MSPWVRTRRALAATRGRGKAEPNAAIAGEGAQSGGGIGVLQDRDSHHDVQDAVATGSNDLGKHVGGVERMATRARYPTPAGVQFDGLMWLIALSRCPYCQGAAPGP